MRTKTALSLISAAAIFASSAVAQEPADEQAMQQMHQRFEQMGQMREQMQNAQGGERHEYMQQHMALMREQMQAMHGMMGQGMMGQGTRPQQGAQDGTGPQMEHMQQRVDLMQQMMGHMLEHHELMMGDADE